MNFFMKSISAYSDRGWDHGTRSASRDEGFMMASRSWGMGLEFSSNKKVPPAGGGGFFSSVDRHHWDHSCTSWRSDIGLSILHLREGTMSDEDVM